MSIEIRQLLHDAYPRADIDRPPAHEVWLRGQRQRRQRHIGSLAAGLVLLAVAAVAGLQLPWGEEPGLYVDAVAADGPLALIELDVDIADGAVQGGPPQATNGGDAHNYVTLHYQITLLNRWDDSLGGDVLRDEATLSVQVVPGDHLRQLVSDHLIDGAHLDAVMFQHPAALEPDEASTFVTHYRIGSYPADSTIGEDRNLTGEYLDQVRNAATDITIVVRDGPDEVARFDLRGS